MCQKAYAEAFFLFFHWKDECWYIEQLQLLFPFHVLIACHTKLLQLKIKVVSLNFPLCHFNTRSEWKVKRSERDLFIPIISENC